MSRFKIWCKCAAVGLLYSSWNTFAAMTITELPTEPHGSWKCWEPVGNATADVNRSIAEIRYFALTKDWMKTKVQSDHLGASCPGDVVQRSKAVIVLGHVCADRQKLFITLNCNLDKCTTPHISGKNFHSLFTWLKLTFLLFKKKKKFSLHGTWLILKWSLVRVRFKFLTHFSSPWKNLDRIFPVNYHPNLQELFNGFLVTSNDSNVEQCPLLAVDHVRPALFRHFSRFPVEHLYDLVTSSMDRNMDRQLIVAFK